MGIADGTIQSDFYPRSPCGERQVLRYGVLTASLISIHALLAESDFSDLVIASDIIHFYPRSPCGERQEVLVALLFEMGISIHALLAESDLLSCFGRITNVSFLSTLSLRRATQKHKKNPCKALISIHALLAESDE